MKEHCNCNKKINVNDIDYSIANYNSIGFVSEFILNKMDCFSEEQVVRLSLKKFPNIINLYFNLKDRKLTIYHKDKNIDEIKKALINLNYGYEHLYTKINQEHVDTNSDQKKSLYLLLLINSALFIFELLYGIIANSSGLISDSLDMLADSMVYGIALYSVGKAYKYQINAAKFAGVVQLLLAISVMLDAIRRFIYGNDPDSNLMIFISIVALIGNIACLYIISPKRNEGIHMNASWIFSANDVLINFGVIVAGMLVTLFNSPYPDLVISLIISFIVLLSARKILMLNNT